MTTHNTRMESPVGPIEIEADGDAITSISFVDGPVVPDASRNPLLSEAVAQLEAYFRGERRTFDLPLRPAGTAFQQRVWAELRRIPYGTTIAYGDLAERVGDRNASRAVGSANGCNPIAIVVPCHRVIGANGALTGYGGGLPIKRALLEHEHALPSREARADRRLW